MQIGTYARTTEQVLSGLKDSPDFIELRMDLHHTICFQDAKVAMREAGVSCTLHLPSDPLWSPIDMATEVVPFVDIGAMIDADLVVFHGPISTMLYEDKDIDDFLQKLPLLYDAANESGISLAIETLVFYYTELMLIFDELPKLRMALDVGHGQIFATRNRAIGHIDSYFDRIETVNIHDNTACQVYQELLQKKQLNNFSKEDLREMALKCDKHLPIGEGTIDFEPIFSDLKQKNYNKRVLMLSNDPHNFDSERQKFLDLWVKS